MVGHAGLALRRQCASRCRSATCGRASTDASTQRGPIAGTGLSAAAPWTARLTSLSGTLFGRPLTGRGEIAHRDGDFELRNVRIANGSSFADVEGRVGPQSLDLAWNVDLRSLAIVVPDMRGELVSQGTARGALRSPELRGSAQLRHFAYGPVTVGRAAADADIDGSDRRPSRVATYGRVHRRGGIRVRYGARVAQRAPSDHALEFAFSSPGNEERRITEFRGDVRAEGALDLRPARGPAT